MTHFRQRGTALSHSEIPVASLPDATVAKRIAGEVAASLGFPPARAAEAEIVASELAHNHVMHRTVRGLIRISGNHVAGTPCLVIASLDQGPGIPDLSSALKGGRSTGGGLGAGLPAVCSLSDHVAVCSTTSESAPCIVFDPGRRLATVIVSTMWAERKTPMALVRSGADLSAIVAPKRPGAPCGDGIHIQGDGRFLRITLFDAEGSGKVLLAKSRRILEELERLALVWPPARIAEAIGRIQDPPRSAALRIVLFDPVTRSIQAAGAGNVSLALHARDDAGSIVSVIQGRPGTGPANLEDAQVEAVSEFWLSMGSDGISSFPPAIRQPGWVLSHDAAFFPAALWAQLLFDRRGGGADDAAIMVMRWRRR